MRTYFVLREGKIIILGTPEKCRAWLLKLKHRNVSGCYLSDCAYASNNSHPVKGYN